MTAKLTNNSTQDANNKRKAIFAGSFNPFTVGHASIVERGLQIFDEIIIVVGINALKTSENAEKLAQTIRKLYNNEPRITVLVWSGLMVELARELNVRFFLRGVRNVSDFEYERNMADINRRLSGIETVLLPSLPEYGYLSSSVVRELESYGVDVSDMVP